jgi:hypothetical protein
MERLLALYRAGLLVGGGRKKLGIVPNKSQRCIYFNIYLLAIVLAII